MLISFFKSLKYFLIKLGCISFIEGNTVGRVILFSEISGSIWKINCKVGDLIETGQDVLVIESMKMEIPVVSNVNGTVISIFVVEGEQVNEDEKLIEFDTED
tara:strand:+ start:1152 stop:1457 length:306 start_codon:yes stop_codon:yes gene_type:complete